MNKKVRFAVILSGCGNMDGSEIHEAVSALLAISNHDGVYSCFAPDITFKSVDYLNGQPDGKERNVLQEAARIARGKIKNLNEYNPDDFDILVLPGGLGVVKNLSDFAFKGTDCSVNNEVKKALIVTHNAQKPIVGLCIAPVLLAKVLTGITVTIGNDRNVAAKIHELGSVTEDKNAEEICIDTKNKIVTTPCYMLADNISEVAKGTDRAIEAAIKLL